MKVIVGRSANTRGAVLQDKLQERCCTGMYTKVGKYGGTETQLGGRRCHDLLDRCVIVKLGNLIASTVDNETVWRG